MENTSILGFASDSWEVGQGTWYDTHIGGQAVLPEEIAEAFVIRPCPRCGRGRNLVLQAFAPCNNHLNRAIYLFGCNSILCSRHEDSWTSIRLLQVGDSRGGRESRGSESGNDGKNNCEAPFEGQVSSGINWDSDSKSEEGGSESDSLVDDLHQLSLEVANARAKREEKGDGDNVSLKGREKSGDLTAFPQSNIDGKSQVMEIASGSAEGNLFDAYYVSVEVEKKMAVPADEDLAVTLLLSKYSLDEKSRASGGVTEPWGAEEDDESAANLAFDEFQAMIASAPEQILRYNFGGEPVWPFHPPPTMKGDRTCRCGSSMSFELQLLGSSLHYLRPEKSVAVDQESAGMDFASIAIYTCRSDCTAAEAVAESQSFKVFSQVVCVQHDEW